MPCFNQDSFFTVNGIDWNSPDPTVVLQLQTTMGMSNVGGAFFGVQTPSQSVFGVVGCIQIYTYDIYIYKYIYIYTYIYIHIQNTYIHLVQIQVC